MSSGYPKFDIPKDAAQFDNTTGILTIYPREGTTELVRIPRTGRLRMQRFGEDLYYYFMAGTAIKLELRFPPTPLTMGWEHPIMRWWLWGRERQGARPEGG